MNGKHKNAHASSTARRVGLALMVICVALMLGIPDLGDARGGGRGGGGGGRGGGGSRGGGGYSGGGAGRAQSSVSASNRSTYGGGGSRASAGSMDRGGGGNRASAGDRASTGNTGGGNRASAGDRMSNSGNNSGNRVNGGDRVNNGNINSGNNNRVNTGDVNIGNNVNINIDGGYGHCCGGGWGGYYRPIAAGIAIGAVAVTTAAIVGSYYRTLPVGCTTVIKNGVTYSYCGSVYYQQTWQGNDVVYVVASP